MLKLYRLVINYNKMNATVIKKYKTSTLRLAVFVIGLICFVPQLTIAASPSVSLTFDDGWLSIYQNAFPILNAAGKKATLYLNSGLVGTPSYMTWGNVVTMSNSGWEIGGHTSTHLELPTLTFLQMQEQISQDYTTLTAHGLIPINFATPFGAYDQTVISEIASYYESHRGFHDIGTNQWPYNMYLLKVRQITNATTLAEVETWIQEAVSTNSWLILVFHEILPTVDPLDPYTWSNANLQALMTLLDTYGLVPQTIAEVLNMKDSIFVNSDFSTGIADGWSTDAPLQVVADLSGKGAVPTQDSSIKFISSATQTNLLSPIVPIASSTEYGIRVFTDTRELTIGELSFYVDEYDQDGVWMSERFLGSTLPNNVMDVAYSYTPTSTSTVQVGLRIYLSASSTGQAFIDNAILFPAGVGGPLPVLHPIVYLTTSLPLQNSSFEAGITQDWTTSNSLQVIADTLGHGFTPEATSSIKFIGGASAAHLFSPHALVDSLTTYNVTANTDTTTLPTGELGFYMDEYDTNGFWITGKWLGMATTTATSTNIFSYTPTSASVRSVSLQTYLTLGSLGEAYVDNLQITVESVVPPPPPALSIPLPNTDFEAGLSLGWTTDTGLQVTADTLNHGSAPNASTSIKFIGSALSEHLFSPHATVGSTTVYSVSVFANTTDMTSGELGFYIDEFGVEGTWISGRWLGFATLGAQATSTYAYSPTSGAVRSVALQAYLTAGASGDVYIDNFEITVAGTTTPPISPTGLPLANSDFQAGIAQNWTTTNALQVIADTSGRGSVPNASSSIKFVGGVSPAHLFSPHALVTFSTLYNVSVYSDTTSLTLGEFGFYMDEFDSNGNWISGKWFGAVTSGTVGTTTYSYTPTSNTVHSISLQTYLTAGATGEAYLDNAQITVAGVVVPPPAPTGIPLPNSDFEAGIAQNWNTTNSLQVTADSLGRGSLPNASSSIKFVGGVSPAHLFSPHALVTTTTLYNIFAYADTTSLASGEFGFYVDEFDANNNWVSGKWLGAVAAASATTTSYSYLPTSGVVSSVSLQAYLTTSSIGDVFLDNFRLELSGI